MCKAIIKDWKKFYHIDYIKSYRVFFKKINKAKKHYADYPNIQKQKFWRSYYNFIKKTIKLFGYMICNNGLIIAKEENILLLILNFEILKNGENFFELYCALKNLKKLEFSDFNPNLKKYLNKNYVSLFKELNSFCENRVETEANYG